MILATCTSGLGASTLSSEAAFNHLSQYFSGSYFSGHLPPPDTGVNAFPFVAVIDLETGMVKAMDTQFFVTPETILAIVQTLSN